MTSIESTNTIVQGKYTEYVKTPKGFEINRLWPNHRNELVCVTKEGHEFWLAETSLWWSRGAAEEDDIKGTSSSAAEEEMKKDTCPYGTGDAQVVIVPIADLGIPLDEYVTFNNYVKQGKCKIVFSSVTEVHQWLLKMSIVGVSRTDAIDYCNQVVHKLDHPANRTTASDSKDLHTTWCKMYEAVLTIERHKQDMIDRALPTALHMMQDDPKFAKWVLVFAQQLERQKCMIVDDHTSHMAPPNHLLELKSVVLTRKENRDGKVVYVGTDTELQVGPSGNWLRGKNAHNSGHDNAWITMPNYHGNPIYLSDTDNKLHFSRCASGVGLKQSADIHWHHYALNSDPASDTRAVTWTLDSYIRNPYIQRAVAMSIPEFYRLVDDYNRWIPSSTLVSL